MDLIHDWRELQPTVDKQYNSLTDKVLFRLTGKSVLIETLFLMKLQVIGVSRSRGHESCRGMRKPIGPVILLNISICF